MAGTAASELCGAAAKVSPLYIHGPTLPSCTHSPSCTLQSTFVLLVSVVCSLYWCSPFHLQYHPKETLALFLPHCLREINELLEGTQLNGSMVLACSTYMVPCVALLISCIDPEHLDSDLPDKTLVWKLQLLSKVHALRQVFVCDIEYLFG